MNKKASSGFVRARNRAGKQVKSIIGISTPVETLDAVTKYLLCSLFFYKVFCLWRELYIYLSVI